MSNVRPFEPEELRKKAATARAKPQPKAPDQDVAALDADDDLARRYVGAHPLRRFVALWSKWLGFDGARLAEDQTYAVFAEIRSMLREVASESPEKRRRDLLSAKTVAAVERLARSDDRAAATSDQWDADDLLLNTPLGLVDLRTGTIGEHRASAYATKITAAGPRGDCPRWRRFLCEVTDDDEALAGFLQRVAGYAAPGLTREHALFFLYGRGANGKGTFLNTLVRLLKDYATVAPMDVFTESNGERHPTELAMLRMIRLVVAQETEEGRRWAESRIKGMTGGDPITARFMRQDFFTFEPKFKLLIAGNHKPKLINVDEAMRRRLHLIPFTVTIPKTQRDTNLATVLEAEAEGIMAWIVAGAVEYGRVGLAPPKTVLEATAAYFGAEDIFNQWLEDRCERGLKHWEQSARLFNDWKAYADASNTRAGDQRTFANRLEAAGFEAGNSRAKGGRHWLGLRLVPSESEGREEWWDR
jgi:putative DNA primase/helicase